MLARQGRCVAVAKSSSPRARTFRQLLTRARELGVEQYLVDGLLPSRSLTLLAGESGLGKSAFVYQLAMCVAAGKPFLGRAVRQGLVLVLDYENGLQQIVQLCRSLRKHLGRRRVPDGLRFWSFNDCPPGDESPESILKLVERTRPALVIIDSLTGYAPNVEENTANAIRCFQDLRCWMKTAGCSVLAIHHLRKPSNQRGAIPPRLDEGDIRKWFHQVRGAGALINNSDVRLGVATPFSGAGDLVLRGFSRLSGDLPLLVLSRDFDGKGEARGYSLLTGAKRLPAKQLEKFRQLPHTFKFKQAKLIYGKGDQPTVDFLRKCIAFDILKQDRRRGEYQKL